MEKRHRILIVEDAALDAELMERALLEAGLRFEAKRVETAPELLEALHNFRPDVVLSDFNLPRLDGMTALPFGTLLCPAAMVAYLWGPTWLAAYMRFWRGG